MQMFAYNRLETAFRQANKNQNMLRLGKCGAEQTRAEQRHLIDVLGGPFLYWTKLKTPSLPFNSLYQDSFIQLSALQDLIVSERQ